MSEQGATYRDIAKEVRISPGNIASILKRHNGESESERTEE